MKLSFKELFRTNLFGVIPFALIMIIMIIYDLDNAFITSQNIFVAIVLVLLYWLLFAVMWSVLTVVLFKMGTWIRKVLKLQD